MPPVPPRQAGWQQCRRPRRHAPCLEGGILEGGDGASADMPTLAVAWSAGGAAADEAAPCHCAVARLDDLEGVQHAHPRGHVAP